VLDAYHDRLAAFRPEVLLAYASALALLAGRLRERGLAPSYPRRACITGAEKLRPDQRAVVESVFAAPVWESYGSRDCGTMAIRPSGDAPYRVAGAAVLLEPWGEPDEAGAREVLVTVLHGRGMPLLRYRIGDRARFGDVPADGPVECLPDVTGRVVDHLRLPDGRRVDGLQFPHFFKDFDVREYRVVQAADGSVRASLVPGPGLGAGDLERIDRVLRANLPGLPVAVETVEELPRNAAGKLRSVVSLYDPGVP
jgi:phenylacetate-CoA ligase